MTANDRINDRINRPFAALSKGLLCWFFVGSKHLNLDSVLKTWYKHLKFTVCAAWPTADFRFANLSRVFFLAALPMRPAHLSLVCRVPVLNGFSLVLFKDAAKSGAVRRLSLKEDTRKYLSSWEDCPRLTQLQHVAGDYSVHLLEKSLVS